MVESKKIKKPQKIKAWKIPGKSLCFMRTYCVKTKVKTLFIPLLKFISGFFPPLRIILYLNKTVLTKSKIEPAKKIKNIA